MVGFPGVTDRCCQAAPAKKPPSNTSPPNLSGRAPARKVGIAVGCGWDYGGMPLGCPWKYREKAVKSPWVTRIIPTPGAVATAVLDARDGHELSADLYGKGHLAGEPLSLMVVCHPRDLPDGEGHPDVRTEGRHPTFPEVIDAGDLLAPGAVFHIVFICTPAGVTREPVDLNGALAVQADQVGEAKKSPLIHARA